MMKVLFSNQVVKHRSDETVATIGNFDGVHLGHRALLAQLHAQAIQLNLPSTMVLFEPQPCEFFMKENSPARLTSVREKLSLIKQAKVDYVYCLKFNDQLSAMSPEVFAEEIIFSRLKVKWLIVGQDFRFGKDRAGDVCLLTKLGAKYDCKVVTFPDFVYQNCRVSSTHIRQLVAQRQLKKASLFLGRPLSMQGRVIHGQGIGRQWGIPTANIRITRKTSPVQGIFCVQVRRDNGALLQGVASLGTRPTLGGTQPILEVNLFDFNENLYGERLEVFFLHHLRDEEKFSSVDELIRQIHQDVHLAKDYFKQRVLIE